MYVNGRQVDGHLNQHDSMARCCGWNDNPIRSKIVELCQTYVTLVGKPLHDSVGKFVGMSGHAP
jgi:hypothetical protein